MKGNRATNQIELAKLVGCHPVTLSRGKKKKGSMSPDTYTRLARITGISRDMWIAGSRKKLEAKLRTFFLEQRLLRKFYDNNQVHD